MPTDTDGSQTLRPSQKAQPNQSQVNAKTLLRQLCLRLLSLNLSFNYDAEVALYSLL